jgi:hypothetical protein
MFEGAGAGAGDEMWKELSSVQNVCDWRLEHTKYIFVQPETIFPI